MLWWLVQPTNTQQGQSRCAAQLEGAAEDTAIPRAATSKVPTCRKPLLDEGEAVPSTDELDVTAGECSPLAGELHGQGGWGAGPL